MKIECSRQLITKGMDRKTDGDLNYLSSWRSHTRILRSLGGPNWFPSSILNQRYRPLPQLRLVTVLSPHACHRGGHGCSDLMSLGELSLDVMMMDARPSPPDASWSLCVLPLDLPPATIIPFQWSDAEMTGMKWIWSRLRKIISSHVRQLYKIYLEKCLQSYSRSVVCWEEVRPVN